jgi:hypothetical protein
VNYFERYLGKGISQLIVLPRILCNQTNCNSRELFDLIANISTKFIQGILRPLPTHGHSLNDPNSSTERYIHNSSASYEHNNKNIATISESDAIKIPRSIRTEFRLIVRNYSNEEDPKRTIRCQRHEMSDST